MDRNISLHSSSFHLLYLFPIFSLWEGYFISKAIPVKQNKYRLFAEDGILFFTCGKQDYLLLKTIESLSSYLYKNLFSYFCRFLETDWCSCRYSLGRTKARRIKYKKLKPRFFPKNIKNVYIAIKRQFRIINLLLPNNIALDFKESFLSSSSS